MSNSSFALPLCAALMIACANKNVADRSAPRYEQDRTPPEAPSTPPPSTSPSPSPGTGAGGAAGVMSVGDIARDPNRYIGQRVTVQAPIDDLKSGAFTFDEDAASGMGYDTDIIVVGPYPDALGTITEAWKGQPVQVSGTLQRATVMDLETQLGWDLPTDLENEVQKASAVLVADSVRPVGATAGDMGNESMGDSTGGGSTGGGMSGSPGSTGDISVSQVTSDPNKYEGQMVTVSSQVGEMHGMDGFTLMDATQSNAADGSDLLVIGKSTMAGNAMPGDSVRVVGQVGKWSPSEIEAQLGRDLTPDVEDAVRKAKAVMIATSVQPMTGQ
jgi:hypothetical protein